MLALAATVGLHWALLQTVAWVGMVAAYSQEGTVLSAIKKTFDGQHPCRICDFVSAGKKSERKQDFQKTDFKFEAHFAPLTCSLFAPVIAPQRLFESQPPGLRTELPPLPPPRAA